MSFYNLSKTERNEVVNNIHEQIVAGIASDNYSRITEIFNDADTYIRKGGYIETGKIYFRNVSLQRQIVDMLRVLFQHDSFKVRQTVINAAGEIGKIEFEKVEFIFEDGIYDKHHSPRNAVIGSIKKMGEVNPLPVINWSKKYLNHPMDEVRREICHGLELRGRKYPEDILPLLHTLQFDKSRRVRKTLIHVVGQITYKKGCLEKVLQDLILWENKDIVAEMMDEILIIHERYKNFSFYTVDEAAEIMQHHR